MNIKLDETLIIFESDKDPGHGFLRVVGNLEKVSKNANDRSITFKEAYQIVFGRESSTLISNGMVTVAKEGGSVQEERFVLAGLTDEGLH